MTPERFGVVLDRLRGRAKTIYFHVKGEPLLHPQLGRLIADAGNAGFPVRITTNGTLLSERLADLRGQANLDRLQVSLHSLAQFPAAEAQTLASRILDAAETLRAENRTVNPSFLVSLRLWTRDNVDATRRTAAAIESFYALEDGFVMESLSGKNSVILKPGLAVHAAETFVWPSLDGEDFGPAGFCMGLRDQAGILVDGTVVPCCLDGDGVIALGNIFETPFADILASPRAQGIYRSFGDRRIEEPLCRRCGYRTRFN
jgi:radical SAM protein with 4Fe4S-binding SPASM domain